MRSLDAHWTGSLIVFSYPFRPFFLAAAVFGIVAVGLWTAPLVTADIRRGLTLDLFWHTHEMIFGFVAAAMAGFLLTAISNWTGRAPVSGGHLALLVSLWLAARISLMSAGAIPPIVLLVIGPAFSWLLMATVAVELVSARNRRNYGFIVLVALFALFDSLHIAAYVHGWSAVMGLVQTLTPHVIVLFITVIAGRIIPAFSTNWLRQHGESRLPVSRRFVELAVIPATVAVGLADALNWRPTYLALLAAIACSIHGIRWLGWRGWQTRREGLLVILHIGYAWLPLAYALLVVAALSEVVSASGALHAMTAGAMGAMIVAVMPRVILGHTGRALHASRPTLIAFALVILAAVLRVAAAAWPQAYANMLILSAVFWVAGFSLFVFVYAPMLLGRRIG